MSILIDRDRLMDWLDAEIAERRAIRQGDEDKYDQARDAGYIEGLAAARFYAEAIAYGVDSIRGSAA